jgi:hypothetical protein
MHARDLAGQADSLCNDVSRIRGDLTQAVQDVAETTEAIRQAEATQDEI